MGGKRTGQIIEIAPNLFRLRIQRGTQSNRKSFDETFIESRQEAEQYLAKCLAKVIEFERTPERAKTVSMMVEEYLVRRARPNISARTYLDYENIKRRYIDPNIGSKLIGNLKALDFRQFYDDLRGGNYLLGALDKGVLKARRGATNLSAAVVKKIHTTLKPAFNYAVEMEWLIYNPIQNVTVRCKKPSANLKIFSVQERELLFDKCRDTDELALWMTAYYLGARPEEYLALKWSDIDLKKGLIKIERVKVEMSGGKQNWLIEKPKTEKSTRLQPITVRVVEVLKCYRENQRARIAKLGTKWNDQNLVFPSKNGNYRQTSNVSRQFKKLLEICGLPSDIRVYDLRHNHSTHLLDAGATLKDVSESLAHSSIRVTADTYLHISANRKKQIVNLLD